MVSVCFFVKRFLIFITALQFIGFFSFSQLKSLRPNDYLYTTKSLTSPSRFIGNDKELPLPLDERKEKETVVFLLAPTSPSDGVEEAAVSAQVNAFAVSASPSEIVGDLILHAVPAATLRILSTVADYGGHTPGRWTAASASHGVPVRHAVEIPARKVARYFSIKTHQRPYCGLFFFFRGNVYRIDRTALRMRDAAITLVAY